MMSVSLQSALNQILNKCNLVLAATIFLTISNVSFADNNAPPENDTLTGNIPIPEAQGTPAQELLVEESPKTKTPAEKNQGKVARAIFTSEIIDREPANELTNIDNTSDRIYFYTDLRNLAGKIVTHRWEYNNAVMAEIKFKVGGGPRWRVYSSKNLLPEWTGAWTVFVTDENEQTLNSSVFNYTQAAVTETAPATTIK